MYEIIILMGSYNGSAYLEEQIHSIQQQTIENWQLIIRDDNSSDHTRELIKKYSDQDNRIILLNDFSHKGVINNFSELLNFAKMHTHAEYYAFADQDDIWLPKKLERSINKINKINLTHQKTQAPSLVFSDLKVVDQKLKTLADSYLNIIGFDPNRSMTLNALCWKNIAPGCACVFNRALLDLLKPLPEAKNIIMHDAYLVQVAASCGKLDYINQALILYRQHGKNSTGATIERHQTKKYSYSKIRHKTISQLICLKEQYFKFMHAEDKKYILKCTSPYNLILLKLKRQWQSSFLFRIIYRK